VVRLWDLRSFTVISEVTGHSNSINSLKFTPDDKQIVSGGEDGSIFIWCVFEEE
jgi:WD40 repeat protein